MSRLNGMTAVVIGSADNIGRATARMLARDGAKVVVGYHGNAAGAAETVGLIEAAGGAAIAVQLDHAKEDDVRALMDRTVETFGGLHILVNNAAATSPALMARDREFIEMDGDYWDEIMRINLKGPMLASKHAIPHMIAAGYGSIIYTGTGGSYRGDSVRIAYTTSKIALNKLAQDVATSYGKQNVRANVVVSGLIMTTAVRENLSEEGLQALVSQNLTPFIGEPDDLAEVTCFLASPASRYVTGQSIVDDGGYLTHQCAIGSV
jgi:NAD(P)-dependent dehydrogenase (short-subunit alcohol dehydrogenase family)